MHYTCYSLFMYVDHYFIDYISLILPPFNLIPTLSLFINNFPVSQSDLICSYSIFTLRYASYLLLVSFSSLYLHTHTYYNLHVNINLFTTRKKTLDTLQNYIPE